MGTPIGPATFVVEAPRTSGIPSLFNEKVIFVRRFDGIILSSSVVHARKFSPRGLWTGRIRYHQAVWPLTSLWVTGGRAPVPWWVLDWTIHMAGGNECV